MEIYIPDGHIGMAIIKCIRENESILKESIRESLLKKISPGIDIDLTKPEIYYLAMETAGLIDENKDRLVILSKTDIQVLKQYLSGLNSAVSVYDHLHKKNK